MTARTGSATDRHKTPLQQRTSPIRPLTHGKAAYKKKRDGGRDLARRSGDAGLGGPGRAPADAAHPEWMRPGLAQAAHSQAVDQ